MSHKPERPKATATAFRCKEARYYDLFHADRDYFTEAELLRKKFLNAQTVLEIGAGTGLLTAQLVARGFCVTALDPSIDMLTRLTWRHLPVATIQKRIEDLDIPDSPIYDLVVAHYDVLNYVKPEDIEDVLFGLRRIARQQSIQVWSPSEGVHRFTCKTVSFGDKLLTRRRFALRIGNTVRLLFVYTGMGLHTAYHKLYLHPPELFS